jgi:hypothetical protein
MWKAVISKKKGFKEPRVLAEAIAFKVQNPNVKIQITK